MSRTDSAAKHCTLVLVRHGHTDMAGTFCGHSDPPLSEEGRAQLSILNLRLKRYSLRRIFSSDLRRARETADAIAGRRNLPVTPRSSLRELNFGEWEGLDWDQIQARNLQSAQRWLDAYPALAAPAGEEFEAFLLRIQRAMNEIADEVQSGCAAVVTHAGVIRTFLGNIASARGKVIDLSNCNYCSCWEIHRKHGRWMLPVEKPLLPAEELTPEQLMDSAGQRT